MPQLGHSAPGQPPRTIPVSGDMAVLGRSADCDIPFPDNNLSRHHCRIRKWAGRWMIEDLQSKNGTFVNGQRVNSANLNPGDLITIGDQMLVFKPDPT